MSRERLKEAHADELQCLKRRIESLESQLEASKMEVQKANKHIISAVSDDIALNKYLVLRAYR